MEENLKKKLSTLINNLIEIKEKYSLRYMFFTLGNTKVENDYNLYFTPIRIGKNFVVTGAIVFSEFEGKKILKEIDGIFDVIYVDSEKKSKSSNLIKIDSTNYYKNINNKDDNSSKEGLFNLERLSSEIITKSKLRYFKGNDVTVESIDKLVFNILKHKKKLIGGSNILVVGMGNIGFKISLKLVERGANINILSTKNLSKSIKLIESINLIKPDQTISETKIFDKNNFELIKNLDIIILTHLSTIDENTKIYNKTSKNCIFIDVGKGCLNPDQIKFLYNKGNLCYRLDIGDSIIDFIENDIRLLSKEFTPPNLKIINNKRIISRGLLGYEDDIVVNDIENPKFVYGICNGLGGFKKKISKKEKLFIKKLIR